MQVRKSKPTPAARPRKAACCPGLAGLLDPKLFRALGDANRLSLLRRLAACGTPRTVSELNTCCPVDLSVVSRHLAILRDSGALESTKRGKEVYYRVRFETLVPLMRNIAGALETCQCATNSCCFSAIESAAAPPATSSRRPAANRSTATHSRKD